jgi:hypothetical protein
MSAGSAADGSFTFADVPRYTNGSLYVITTFWDGIEQNTIPATADQIIAPIEFILYETTDSLSDVIANRGNLRIEFEDVNAVGIEMLLELSYINLGDRIIFNENGFQMVELPVGAYGIAVEPSPGDIQRYETVDSFPIPGVLDTQPLIPGVPNVMRVSFLVPYEEGAVIDMRFPFAVTDLGVFVREETVTLESSLLALSDTQETSSGRIYDVYAPQKSLNPGEPFKFTLMGKPTITVRNPTTTRVESDSSFAPILIALVLGGFILLAGAVIWLLRTRATPDKTL